jgi:hypothetical protein
VAEPQTEGFIVHLPAGGQLHLQSAEEVSMWETAEQNYRRDYALDKANDLVLLGAILSQQLALFRAQQEVNGMKPEFDAQSLPTGKYKRVALKPTELKAAQDVVIRASKEIRELESTLGIDKKTRDAGGKETVADYLKELKLAGGQFGIHISERVLAYEEFCMALRTKLRILANGDEEDKAYEGVSEASVLEWARGELARLEEVDKTFAKEKGKVFVGRL